MNLYKDSNQYIVHHFSSRDEWLSKRIHGCGGSDASILIGLNPYKTNNQLWKEKKGLAKAEELSNDAIEHGNDLEPVLRHWFKASYPEYDVQYQDNTILQSKTDEWRLYSPDGLLYHDKEGPGIFEAKTTLIQNSNMLQEWNNRIPMHYYIQVLHGLLTTNFNYVYLVAELRFAWDPNKVEFRTYKILKKEKEEDLKWLKSQEEHAWHENYVMNKEPALILFL